jgi:AcrR family transcriptional regulator
MPLSETKRALLDAAEALFADRGFAATSMRDISVRAGVNLAAANYHFGGKHGLMRAVLERRVTPLNRCRLEGLAALEAAAGRRRVPLAGILEAFVGPALQMAEQFPDGGEAFVRLMGRTFIEPDAELHAFFMALFEEVAARFIPAIQRAVPHLPAADLYWRLHFMIGCMAHTLGDKEQLRSISGGLVDPDDTGAATRQLVAFLVGGLQTASVTARRRRTR